MRAASGRHAVKFLRLILEQTEADELTWEETERSFVFQASFTKYSVRIGPSDAFTTLTLGGVVANALLSSTALSTREFVLKVYGENGQEVDTIFAPGPLNTGYTGRTELIYSATEIRQLLSQIYDKAKTQVEIMETPVTELIHELEQRRKNKE